jgi:hypothetical protein
MPNPNHDLAYAACRLIAVQGAARTPRANEIWHAVMAAQLAPTDSRAVNWVREGQQYRAHDVALLAGIVAPATAPGTAPQTAGAAPTLS